MSDKKPYNFVPADPIHVEHALRVLDIMDAGNDHRTIRRIAERAIQLLVAAGRNKQMDRLYDVCGQGAVAACDRGHDIRRRLRLDTNGTYYEGFDFNDESVGASTHEERYKLVQRGAHRIVRVDEARFRQVCGEGATIAATTYYGVWDRRIGIFINVCNGDERVGLLRNRGDVVLGFLPISGMEYDHFHNDKAVLDKYEDAAQQQFGTVVAELVWCVRHTEGWCACVEGFDPTGSEKKVRTNCGHYVIDPIAFEQRIPDCPECQKAKREGRTVRAGVRT